MGRDGMFARRRDTSSVVKGARKKMGHMYVGLWIWGADMRELLSKALCFLLKYLARSSVKPHR